MRFERAEDLTRVAQWLETSHRTAPQRADAVDAPGESPAAAKPAARGGANGAGGGRGRARATRPKANDGHKRAASKASPRRKPASR